MLLKVLCVGILAVVFLISDISATENTDAQPQPTNTPPASATPTTPITPPANGTPTTPTPGNTPAPSTNPADILIDPAKYPTPKRDDSVQDTYAKSTVIKDPFRVFENPDSPETKQFIKDEMAITKPYLEKFPSRKELKARYTELNNYAKYDGLFQHGSKYFSFQNTGLQNQGVLYIHDTPNANDEGRVFLDPNTFSTDGTVLFVSGEFSDDGLVYAYFTQKKGSDYKTLQFKNVEKGDMYTEKLTNIKYSDLNWLKNNKGVFYETYPDQAGNTKGSDPNTTKNKNHKLFYHLLGTEQSKDVIVAEFLENPDYFIAADVTDCGKYLIVSAYADMEKNLVYVADLGKIKYEINGKLELIPLVTKMEASYWYVTNVETQLIFITNKDAENYKLISVDITQPNSWKDIVAEDKKNNLEWAKPAWDKYLVLCYTVDVKSVLQLHELATGKMVKKFDLEIGTVSQKTFHSDKKYKDIYFTFESYLTPATIYYCDLSKPPYDLVIFKEIKLKKFDRTKYTVEQLFYNSKDGTKIPMSCVYRKGLEKTGNNFAFLFAYGGFGSSLLPSFSVNRLMIVDNLKGVHCIANIRGGGEYGNKWHKDGSLDKKQNSFDDFKAAAKFLSDEKFTSPKLLAANGSTNGGLVMAVSLEQAPELFGAFVIGQPITDMLRYDKFSCGRAWVSEYGTATNEKDFQYLIKYSPLQNVKMSADKQYPATLIVSVDHNERLPPFHSFKFIATLQAEAKKFPNQKNPLLLYVETTTDSQDPVDKKIDGYVNMLSFMMMNTGVQFQPCQDA